ncbi:MAG TPA: hypothetical protein VG897_11510 [Terriglobales bacterium]|nr:hypothetical protein [Terriglobales bacterium]
MIFTHELKKEVFGPARKNTTLGNAKIVERTSLKVQALRTPTLLKAAKQIAQMHKDEKTEQ